MYSDDLFHHSLILTSSKINFLPPSLPSLDSAICDGHTERVTKWILCGILSSPHLNSKSELFWALYIQFKDLLPSHLWISLLSHDDRKKPFHVRFDENFSREVTRIKFLTEGILIRELMGDPLLNTYSVLILDEVSRRFMEFKTKKIMYCLLIHNPPYV